MNQLKINLRSATLQSVRAHDGLGEIQISRLISQVEDNSELLFLDCCIVLPGSSIGQHSHDDIEETYVMISGKAMMRLMKDKFAVQTGDVIRIPVGADHELWNTKSEDARLIVCAVKRVR